MKKRNKLVRDLVVRHIEAKGDPCVHHVAREEERAERLGFKLLEEAEEFANAKNPEELIDVIEVVCKVEEFGRHVRPTEDELAEKRPPPPNAGDADGVLTARIYLLIDACSEYAARPTDGNFKHLIYCLEAVVLATGFERETLELMRKKKLETHGGFEQWIILDES